MLGGIAVAPMCPSRYCPIERCIRVVERAGDDGRERLRLSEGVSDALPGRRVLEVAGVTDQSPARTSGFAKETLELQEPEHLSHGTRAGEHFGDRSARPRVSHERRLAFPSKLGQEPHIGQQDHLI